MPSTPGKQHIDLIRHRELNALRRMMAQRVQSPAAPATTESTTYASALLRPAKQTMARIDALEAQMTTMANPTVFAPSSAFESGFAAHTLAQPKAEQAQIHEAASFFAANHISQAQQHLEQAIHAQGLRLDHVPTWLALLDLYRATDQAAQFDALAMDFAIRFGRSAPSWLSLPALAVADLQSSSAYAASAESTTTWTSPALLGAGPLESLGALIADKAKQGRSLVVDWRDLLVIDSACWELLAQTLHTLANAHMPCTVQGAGQFALLLNADTAPAALAQMAWLRCQNAAQPFDDAAIAYCAEFEVSPPDWQAPACQLELRDDVFYLNAAVTPANANSLKIRTSELALVGEITERLPPAFSAYSAFPIAPDKTIVVACERLVRMDPAATLELRLWTSALHAQGVSVTLRHAHRVVAAYFLSQGIYAFAKVTPRTD